MTRVVVRPLATKKRTKASHGAVVSKSIHVPGGKRLRILSIDANSPSFATDLSVVFERNVAKARRENKKKFGSSDPAARKA